MTTSYVCVDLETTGLNPKYEKIIEIGAVKVVDGHITERFSAFVNPGRKLEERIIELTGISQKQVDDAPYIEEILPKFLEFCGDYALLGHRILFDYSFLKKAAVNQKLMFERKGLDTLRMARRFLPELPHRTLPYLCEYYEIPHRAHRALQDAEATSELYRILLEKFYAEGEECFLPQSLHYQVKKETPITKSQKERLLRILAQHKLTLDVEIDKLTRSEASRITDKILAKYGR